MAHWLVKSEPSVWSWDQQVEAGAKGVPWNGVRNHAAKLNMMKMKKGDQAFFYHSNEGLAIVGVVQVVKEAYPDPETPGEPWVLVDLNDILTSMEKMLRRVIGEDVQLAIALGADLPKVFVDPGQIEQVVMNLVVNARDAMPRGGRLMVETTGGAALLSLEGGDGGLVASTELWLPQPEIVRLRLVAPADAELRLPSSRLTVTAIDGDRAERRTLFLPAFLLPPGGEQVLWVSASGATVFKSPWKIPLACSLTKSSSSSTNACVFEGTPVVTLRATIHMRPNATTPRMIEVTTVSTLIVQNPPPPPVSLVRNVRWCWM